MTSWLPGGLKSSLTNFKDQVTNSIKDALEELDEEETDGDLLDEETGRDAGTRLLMAVDRLRDLRQTLDQERKQVKQLKELNQNIVSDKQSLEEQNQRERVQFKELLKDKEEEIDILTKQSMQPNGEFEEINQLLNAEKQKNHSLQAQIEANCSKNNPDDDASYRTEDLKVIESLKEQITSKENSISEFQLIFEKLNGQINEKDTLIVKLKSQHENAIQILKQSTEVAVNENNELSEQIIELENKLKSSENQAKSAHRQIDLLQQKLEEFSQINEETSKLKAEKLQLEMDKSKLEDQLREVQTRLDNGQNEQLEHSKTWDEDKVSLENECSELKEKIDILLQDLKTLKEKSVHDDQKICQLNEKVVSLEILKNEEIVVEKANAEKEFECRMLEQKEEHEKNIVEIQNQLVSKETEFDNLQVEFQQTNEKNKFLEKEKEEIAVEKANVEKELECKMLEQKEEHDKKTMEMQNQLLSKETEFDNLQVEFQQINEKNKVLEKKNEEITVEKANTDKELECKILEQEEEHDKNIMEIQNQLVAKETEFDNLQVEFQQINEKNKIMEKELQEQLSAQNVEKSSENEQIEHWKFQYTETRNEIEILTNNHQIKIDDLTEKIEKMTQQLTNQEGEIEAMEQVITCLKDKNQILESHNEESFQESEQFQNQLSSMKTNFEELTEALANQTAQNEKLQQKLNEALEAKSSVDDILNQFSEKSAIHETTLKSLHEQLEQLKEADVKASEYSKILNQQQTELDDLKSKLQLKNDAFDDMKKETDIYKQQYEGLLEEYQQYLQDLESLQVKSDGLERWKTLYENEISDLKSAAIKQDEALEEANSKISALNEKEEERSKLSQKVMELESALSKEKTLNRELKDNLEEQETLFQNMNMKEILNEEEKEKDESELRKVEELQEIIENVQAEKVALGSKIELLIKDHKLELDNLVSELEEMEKIKKENEDLDNALKAKEAEKSNMLGVLQEKTRSHSQMKSENARLLQSISDLQNKLTEKDQEEMSKDAIHQLSKMVKDKDLEIEGLKSRNESLVTLVQNNTSNEIIEKLTKEKEDLLEKMNQDSIPNTGNKSVIDNSNEIIILKSKISDLEKKLSFAEVKVEMQDASLTLVNKDSRRRYHSESLDQEYSQELKIQVEHLNKEKEDLLKQIQSKDELVAETQDDLRTFKRKSETIELHFNDNEKQLQDIKTDFEQCQTQLNSKSEEISKLKTRQDRLNLELEEKVHDLAMARNNIEQLKVMLEEKSSTSENNQMERLQNIAAIQELQSNITQLMKQRDEAQLQANEKDRQLSELRREVNNVIDKKKRLEHELERLKQHLVQVEEGYTNEALASEERERELRKKLQVTEEALRLASTQQTNTTKVATIHLQKLEAQVTDLTRERDQLAEKNARISHEYTLQSKAMGNLNSALEGFQNQKENEMKWAEKDFDGRLLLEKKKQDELLDQIDALKQKVANANEGLAAANRLSEQLEKKTQTIAMLKHEIKLREDLLKKAQNELKDANSSNTVKVDRYLVKNLVVGYVNADQAKKREVLKIIATVLDFNQDEREKTGLDGQAGGWLSTFFGQPSSNQRPNHRRTSSTEIHEATGLDMSLAQAFVAFLQTESTPKTPMKLPLKGDEELNSTNSTPNSNIKSPGTPSSGRSTPTSAMPTLGLVNPNFSTSANLSNNTGGERSASASPLLFNTNSTNTASNLPMFNVNRSSSSILRQVLQEEDGDDTV